MIFRSLVVLDIQVGTMEAEPPGLSVMGEGPGLLPFHETEHWGLLPMVVKGWGGKKSPNLRMGV